ncbi:Ig-like domain-containing protein [Clostridium boliviensis]|uniref:Ig-like domain-containing protein n=1 Tax=Clostridium boliviensis TaxID=318465 RepID=A0ABU4GQI9_9CLOT|nr:Ig-like domain-containing protein [Clostridium boliviensis]MDW2799910.1 Ig-like domain-containing protein [Clostridium boliviensis]
MSKRALLRLVTSICFMLCVMIFGQVTVFADEVKPDYEYNFDSEARSLVVDTGTSSNKVDGTSYGDNAEKFYTGYDGIGKARYFNGINDYISFRNKYIMHPGEKSLRFKMKKEASTFSGKVEAIITNTNLGHGFFVGIGAESHSYCPAAKNGTLYICSLRSGPNINFEIQTPESVCDGKWHDVFFVWDGTKNENSVKLYLDDMSSPIAQTTAKYDNEPDPGFGVTIGKFSAIRPETNENGMYNGYIDNIQLYNTAISLTSATTSNLKALGSNSKVDLTWDAVNKATSYTVKRAITAGGPYTAIATDITDTSYTDTAVTNGTTYYYIITAINNGTEISDSNEASAKPITDQTPPTTETKLKVVLEVAESLRLSVDDDLNVNAQMSWSSSDPTVATVNEKGIVSALAPGNTVITVKSVDGSYTDYINVLVVENADDYRLAIDLKIGETARLTADDFTNTANITWAPMDSSIANVTSKGKVTALSKGLVLISAKDAEGNIIGRVYVRVRE